MCLPSPIVGGTWLNFNPSERLLKETKGVSVYKPMLQQIESSWAAGQLSEDVLKREDGVSGPRAQRVKGFFNPIK